MTNHRTNKRLLLALAEIWKPYTSRFVTAFGEITFTVEDAFMLGRLPTEVESAGDMRDEERYYRKQLKSMYYKKCQERRINPLEAAIEVERMLSMVFKISLWN